MSSAAINRGKQAIRKKREYGTNGKERKRRNQVGSLLFSVYSVLFRLFRTLSSTWKNTLQGLMWGYRVMFIAAIGHYSMPLSQTGSTISS